MKDRVTFKEERTRRVYGGHVVQLPSVTHVYEGRQLEEAVKRAKRWIRGSRRRRGREPSRHVLLALRAFAAADHEGFKAYLKEHAT